MIYDNVKNLCEKQGLTIMALEQRAGLANGTIGGWRNSKPMAESLLKVSQVLGVPMEELMKQEEATE